MRRVSESHRMDLGPALRSGSWSQMLRLAAEDF